MPGFGVDEFLVALDEATNLGVREAPDVLRGHGRTASSRVGHTAILRGRGYGPPTSSPGLARGILRLVLTVILKES